jgi:chemotaxis protein CheZ
MSDSNPKKPARHVPAETKVVVAGEQGPDLAGALEQLLEGFGHGNIEQVRLALSLLGNGPEIDRLNGRAQELLAKFHRTVWAVKDGLDPSSITMTSTNIPDAARKLEYVLSATNDATHKLFGLVEHQESVLKREEAAMAKLHQSIAAGADPRACLAAFEEEHKSCIEEGRKVLSEMVMTQTFQDLCGQALKKVLKLVQELESNLSCLLSQLRINVEPPKETTSQASPGVSQDDVDDLLKQFGF